MHQLLKMQPCQGRTPERARGRTALAGCYWLAFVDMGYFVGYVYETQHTKGLTVNYENDEPSKAQFLASLLHGSGSMEAISSTVQRSHRFPLHLMLQIENMAEKAGVPVSLIINQLLECGLEAVSKELTEEQIKAIITIRPEQLDRKTATQHTAVKSTRKSSVKVERSK